MLRWPWIMTVLSGLVLLNPFSLMLMASLIGFARHLLADLIFLVGGLLIFLGLIAWLIRTEIARARLQRVHEDRHRNA
jgi:hypothetical protein